MRYPDVRRMSLNDAAEGSQLMLAMVDSVGNSGGVSPNLYNMTGTRTVHHHARVSFMFSNQRHQREPTRPAYLHYQPRTDRLYIRM